MKNKLILAFALIMFCTQLCVSQVLKTIILDFPNRTFSGLADLKDLEKGDLYRIEIKDINSNLYEIQIGKVDSTSTKPLTLPGFSGFGDLSALAANISALGGVASVGGKTFTEEELLAAFNKVGNGFQIQSLMLGEDKGIDKSKKPTPAEQAAFMMAGAEAMLKHDLQSLQEYQRNIENLLIQFQLKALSYQTPNLEAVCNNKFERCTLITNFQNYRKILDSLSSQLINQSRSYRKEKKLYSKEINADEKLKERDQKIEKLFDEFEPSIELVRKPINAENASKLFSTLVSLEHNTSTSYCSLPMQFNSGRSVLDIEIKPRANMTGLHTYKTQLQLPLPDNKKFWGISSGFFVSTLNGDKSYSTRATQLTDSSLSYKLVDENSVMAEFGINSMVRYGTSINKKNTAFWQFGFGPAVSIKNKLKPRLQIGTGVGFGKDHMVLFDIGMTIGYYDRLSKSYSKDETYTTKPEQVTVSDLGASFHFSVSYLFLK